VNAAGTSGNQSPLLTTDQCSSRDAHVMPAGLLNLN